VQLAGKVAVVTGASRGLGRAIALEYAAQGARLVLCARGADGLAGVEREIRARGEDVVAVAADVGSAEQATALMAKAVDTYGRIDILVNNAGVAPGRGALLDTPLEAWHAILAVNLTGVFLCSRAAVPHMRQAGGAIVNVSSRLGRGRVVSSWGAYAVAKHGVEGITAYLAEELRGDAIRVNSVAPGLLATEMTGFEGAPPESVLDVFVFLASDAARAVSGRALLAGTWREELARSPALKA
jgi:NAD(P)-dependent dehydrogenase (short-subunit alcohol dehydrogenase family)